MAEAALKHYKENIIGEFRMLKRMGEKAMAQLDDEQFFKTIDPESNSIAIIVKHMVGNMRSRFTDFLTSDGEKPDRNRDQEFIIDDGIDRNEVMKWWDDGWKLVFDAIEPLQEDDLMREILIRLEPHTVIQALNRQLSHYAMHIGQIVYLSKHLKSTEWKTLSVPRGESEQFNQKMIEIFKQTKTEE